MFSCLMSRQSRISCQFHVRKTRILLIFSWANEKKISTKRMQSDLVLVVVKV